MKHFFQYAMLVTLLALSACGKNKSGGTDTPYYGGIQQGQLNPNSVTALNNFLSWYNTPVENYPYGIYSLTYINGSLNSNNGCTPNNITVGGVVIGQYYICSGGGSNSGTSTTCKVSILASNYQINVKPNNPVLSMIANGQAGVLVQARQQGSIFDLDFQKSTGEVVSYKIDVNLHSSMQPVQIIDPSTGIFEYLGYQPSQGASAQTPFCN